MKQPDPVGGYGGDGFGDREPLTPREVATALGLALVACALALAAAFLIGCIFLGPPAMVAGLLS